MTTFLCGVYVAIFCVFTAAMMSNPGVLAATGWMIALSGVLGFWGRIDGLVARRNR